MSADKKKGEEKKVVRLSREQIDQSDLEIAITADDLTEEQLKEIAGGVASLETVAGAKSCACACSPKTGLTTGMMAYSNKALKEL